MTALNLNLEGENRKKVVFVNFTDTKRIQWDRYRRYGI
jgi:hypothetical protein